MVAAAEAKETVKGKVSFFRAIAFMYQVPDPIGGFFILFPLSSAFGGAKDYFLSGNNASPFVSQLRPKANNAKASSQNIGLYSSNCL